MSQAAAADQPPESEAGEPTRFGSTLSLARAARASAGVAHRAILPPVQRALLLLGLVSFGLTSPAAAQCPKDVLGCFDDEVMFMWSDTLFDTIDLDTGWVPGGSPLQIRLGFHLAGETQIDMMGTTYAYWPTALSILPAGMLGGGRISVDYGLEIIARIRFDVSVAGVRYTWEGDIPIPGGIPRDLRVADETFFDPFVLPGADPRPVTLTDTTDTIEVVNASLGSIIPVPGVDGGFTLGVRGQLDAGYAGDRIDVIRREVPGNPAIAITEDGGVAVVPAPVATGYGAAEDVAIDPAGTVTYRGALVAVPSFFIEVVGRTFSFPLATIDVPIVDTDSSPDFVPAEIHIPLPDVAVVGEDRLDFGTVNVGDRAERTARFRNDGEAELVIRPRVAAPDYEVPMDEIRLPPSGEATVVIGFAPTREGSQSQLLAFDTNDPDRPLVTLRAVGEGFLAPMPDAGPRDGGVGDASTAPGLSGGACGCRAVSRRGPSPLWLLLGVAVLVRRRRG